MKIKNQCREIEYKKLPLSARKAIKWFATKDGGNCIDYHTKKYGYGIIATSDIIECVMNDEDIKDFKSFAEYHDWYDVDVIHPIQDIDKRWAVLIDNEIIVDGWHRFHSYINSGYNEIPVIYYL